MLQHSNDGFIEISYGGGIVCWEFISIYIHHKTINSNCEGKDLKLAGKRSIHSCMHILQPFAIKYVRNDV